MTVSPIPVTYPFAFSSVPAAILCSFNILGSWKSAGCTSQGPSPVGFWLGLHSGRHWQDTGIQEVRKRKSFCDFQFLAVSGSDDGNYCGDSVAQVPFLVGVARQQQIQSWLQQSLYQHGDRYRLWTPTQECWQFLVFGYTLLAHNPPPPSFPIFSLLLLL